MAYSPPKQQEKLVSFPAYSYAFIARGVNHTRTFAAWVIFSRTGLECMRRPIAVKILAKRFDITVVQARSILRRGEGKFWITVSGIVYPNSPAEIWALVKDYKLAPALKRSLIAVPESALRSILELRAHLALPIMSRSADKPTPRAYSAKALRRHKMTISRYRDTLIWARYITVQPNYQRTSWDGRRPLAGNEFLSEQGDTLWRRLPDTVVVSPPKVFISNRSVIVKNRIAYWDKKNKTSILPLDFRFFKFNPNAGWPKGIRRPVYFPPSRQSRWAARRAARESQKILKVFLRNGLEGLAFKPQGYKME